MFPFDFGFLLILGFCQVVSFTQIKYIYIYMGSVIGMLFRIYSFNIVYTFWDIPNTLLAPFMLPFFETLLGVSRFVQ